MSGSLHQILTVTASSCAYRVAADPSVMAVPRSASPAGTQIPWGNLDDSDQFSDALDRLKSPRTKNFAVPFSAKEARVSFDLDGPQCEELLQAHVGPPRAICRR